MNILVIRMHRFGDILQLTPMLRGLKKKYSDCRITFFTGSEMSELLADNSDVDEVISIPENKYRYYLKNRPEYYARIYNEMYELVSDLKGRRFQMIINRHYEFGGMLAHLISAEQIFGQFFSPESGVFLNDPISTQLYDTILTKRKTNRRNLVDWACLIAGLPPGLGEMCFSVPEIDLFMAEHLLSEHGAINDPLIAVQIGAAKSFRRWGADNYYQVIKWLIESKGKKVVLLGKEDEIGEADNIRLRLGQSNQYMIDLIGKTDFKTLGGILKKCQNLITGDTGTMHMSAAVGTPVIALFYGTAFPWETGPYGTGHIVLYADEKCAPCFHPEACISGHLCRNSITPEHVCKAFEISEEITENNTLNIDYPSGNVKLYLTYAKPGCDQTLIPINEISNIQDIRDFPDHPERVGSKGEGISESMDHVYRKGNHLLQKLYRGDSEGFTDLFPEYVGQWIKIISYIKEKHVDENISVSLIQCLIPAINEATRAMQAQDYTALSDLIQYDFKNAIAMLTGASPHTAYKCERRMLQ
ncbi:MAG: glycosyltransferase family 9 protein [Deltaproteobacteria bacterium]|nr:MAG: glycosyltransferase family 9 protein [Deltaproteobacteria bacterium]